MSAIIVFHIVLYTLGFVGGWVICISMAIDVLDFNGMCLLYGTGTWSKTTFNASFGAGPICHFVLGLSAAVSLYSLIMLIYCSVLVCRRQPGTRGHMVILLPMIFNIVFCVLTLVMSSLITKGFQVFCYYMQKDEVLKRLGCEAAQTYIINWSNVQNGTRFYDVTMVCQLAGWSVFLLYFVMTIISMVRCRRDAKIRGAFNDNSGFVTPEQLYPPELPYASPHGQLKMMEDESEEQSPFQ